MDVLHFWWLIFPLGGAIAGGIRAVAAANERRAERRLERYRIKQQTKIAVAEASGRGKVDEATARRDTTKLLERHDRTDARWLTYEVDVAEAEAIRRRRSDFSTEGQERIERAQRLLRLASDEAATSGERQNAYAKAQRELDGLIVLPAVARSAIESRILGQLET